MKSSILGAHSHGGHSQPQASPSGQAVREQTGPWSPRCCKAHRCKCQGPPLWPPRSEWSHPPSRSNPGSAGAQTAEWGATVRGQKFGPSPWVPTPARPDLSRAAASLGRGLPSALGEWQKLYQTAGPHRKPLFFPRDFWWGVEESWQGPRPSEAASQ